MRMATVLLTDHPWPDLAIERAVIEGAGHRLVAGPEIAGTAMEVEALVASCSPQAILTCWAPVSGAAIRTAGDLAIVARLGVGLDNIDVTAATERGAWVTNVPDYCVPEVSDHAVALVLDHCRGISRLDSQVKQQGWKSDAGGLLRLGDLAIGIIGYGRIGRETARKFRAFGSRILVHDPQFHGDEMATPSSLADLQAHADVIVLHAPLTDQTRGMIDQAFLAGARKRPLIVNVSRGPLIDNDALVEALTMGWICGAALDVVDGEPRPPAELMRHPKLVVTPHVAYASNTAMAELRRRACEEVVRVLAGDKPENPRNNPDV